MVSAIQARSNITEQLAGFLLTGDTANTASTIVLTLWRYYDDIENVNDVDSQADGLWYRKVSCVVKACLAACFQLSFLYM